MTEAPGERFALLFDMPRGEQIARLRAAILALDGVTDDEQIEAALSDISYDVHTIRESLWYAARERIRAANPQPRVSQKLATTLEDLI